jgi:hypothetical protein
VNFARLVERLLALESVRMDRRAEGIKKPSGCGPSGFRRLPQAIGAVKKLRQMTGGIDVAIGGRKETLMIASALVSGRNVVLTNEKVITVPDQPAGDVLRKAAANGADLR